MIKPNKLGTIFCAGGNEKGVADNSSEFYDWSSRIWRPAAAMKKKRSDFGLACTDGKVFAIGGWTDFGKRLNSVEVYDPASDQWRLCSSMGTTRSQVTACLCHQDGSIYAIGGEGRRNMARRCVERYDAYSNRWTKGPKMLERRWSACSCCRLDDGCIYVAGGYDELSGGALATCERFDPRSGQWSKIASLDNRRCGAACAVLEDGNIYVVGGTNEKMALLATCECYNPKVNRWESLPAMKFARSFFGVAPFDNGRFLYAVGGADSVEIYDPRAYAWTTSNVQLGRKRSRHAVVWCDWTRSLSIENINYEMTRFNKSEESLDESGIKCDDSPDESECSIAL